jgi:hypothetical protein
LANATDKLGRPQSVRVLEDAALPDAVEASRAPRRTSVGAHWHQWVRPDIDAPEPRRCPDCGMLWESFPQPGTETSVYGVPSSTNPVWRLVQSPACGVHSGNASLAAWSRIAATHLSSPEVAVLHSARTAAKNRQTP